MDNLTHTLIGLVAGETVTRTTHADPDGIAQQPRRTALLAIGMIGGNLPDSDLLWSLSTVTGDRMGYLLEHRGHTHTILGCLALAVVLYVAAVWWLHHKKLQLTRNDYRLFAGMSLLSVMLHLVFDALNSYGIHPFWPWNNRWYYADAVFIVEPLFWMTVAPILFVMRSRSARVLLGLVLLIGSLALLFVHRFAAPWFAVPVLVLTLVWWGRQCQARTAALASLALIVSLSLGFIALHREAAKRVEAVAQDHFPAFDTLDHVLSPVPTQPLCWDVLLVQDRADEYVVRRGQLALSGVSCSPLLGGGGTAPMQAVPVQDGNGMTWAGQFAMSRAAFVQHATEDCHARELMQFARAPFAAQTDTGWVLGDMRFDREPGLGMAEVRLDPEDAMHCKYDVPWIPPRSDLLQRGSR